MAPGDGDVRRYDEEPPAGEVTTASGRVSIAREVRPSRPALPFTRGQLRTLDETLTRAVRTTGLHFSIYLGDLGDDTHARAEQLHKELDNGAVSIPAAQAVLLAVSPGQRVVEVVTGSVAHRRLPDRACHQAVTRMVSSFAAGELPGGLLSGLRILMDEAGSG